MDEYGQEEGGYGGERFFSDLNTRLRDLEEKQRLLRDKIVLVTKSLIGERDKSSSEIINLRKEVESLKMDNERMKAILARVAEIVEKSARREDLMILQRQFDLFRE